MKKEVLKVLIKFCLYLSYLPFYTMKGLTYFLKYFNRFVVKLLAIPVLINLVQTINQKLSGVRDIYPCPDFNHIFQKDYWLSYLNQFIAQGDEIPWQSEYILLFICIVCFTIFVYLSIPLVCASMIVCISFEIDKMIPWKNIIETTNKLHKNVITCLKNKYTLSTMTYVDINGPTNIDEILDVGKNFISKEKKDQ